MGQQQLLLIILAVLTVALAIIAGLWLFRDNAGELNRRAVIKDLHQIFSIAHKYYRTPSSIGGGDNSFEDFKIPPDLVGTTNGTYSHIEEDHDSDHIHFEGIGNETGKDGINPIRIEIRIEGRRLELEEHN